MRIALVADTFPPLRTSGAVQLRDLSREFARQGHSVTVLLPSAEIASPCVVEEYDGVQVLRLKAPPTKDIGYVCRTLAEFLMPFHMLRNLRRSPSADVKWDGVVWYAPSIFHGPLAKALKAKSRCRGYLIIRDIFPEWAVDMGLMGRGLPYLFFRTIARYQYSVANVIGVQTPGNERYFSNWRRKPGRSLEVLQNWLGKPAAARCTIQISETPLVGRRILVYAGNMGIAQGMGVLLELAERLKDRTDLGFLFVGRGSDAQRLKASAQERNLSNVYFHDEIHPDEIPNLYEQCSVGLVALDPRHKSHNIPGKFLTYMQSGLPALAFVNAGNDLANMIRRERVGQVCESGLVDDLQDLACKLMDEIDSDHGISERCRGLFQREFSAEKAVQQIVAALQG